jgi:hypothetical protein
MRRVKGDFENLKSRMGSIRDQARGLATGLKKEGLSSPAGKMELVLRRMESICGICVNLGNTAPGLDEANLRKISAEWQICCRLARNTTGVGPLGSTHQRLVEGITETDQFFQNLMA